MSNPIDARFYKSEVRAYQTYGSLFKRLKLRPPPPWWTITPENIGKRGR